MILFTLNYVRLLIYLKLQDRNALLSEYQKIEVSDDALEIIEKDS